MQENLELSMKSGEAFGIEDPTRFIPLYPMHTGRDLLVMKAHEAARMP